MKHFLSYLFLALVFLPVRLAAQADASFTYRVAPLASYLVRFQSVYQDADTLTHTFLWDFGDGLTADVPNPEHLFPAAGTFTVGFQVTHKASSVTDFSTTQVDVTDQLAVPNVFTPNMDGDNDYFIIPSNGKTVLSFKVFNRWGSLVYQATASTIIWDGKTADGTPVVSGNYFYILRALNGERSYERTGFVRIFR